MSAYSTEFQSAINHLRDALNGVRTNRANPSMVENLAVQAYGSTMKLLEVASIAAPEPQLLTIQAWDQSLIPAIEAAIREDEKLQVSPVVDGQLIRIPLPALTEERRRDLVKIVGGIIEEARIHVRKIREDLMKTVKSDQKQGALSEDELFRAEKEIQEAVDAANKTIQELADAKEKDLMSL